MAKQPSCVCFRRAGKAVFNVASYVKDLEPAIGTLSGAGVKDAHGQATAVLLHRCLVLTSHVTLPEISIAFDAEVSFKQNEMIIRRKLNPKRLFITDAGHDLTLVACEEVPNDLSPLPMDTNRAYGGSFKAGHKVYILGHSRRDEQNDPVTVGQGKVVAPHSDEKTVQFQVKGKEFWVPGSAGFDSWGNFAFIVCSPKAWLPKDSNAKKKRFSLMALDRREQMAQTGLTIHSISEWMEKELSERQRGTNYPDSSIAGPEGLRQDLQPLEEVVHGLC